MFFAKVLLLASLSTLSVNALYTPMAHRSTHQHRGLAARVAAAAPEVSPIVRVTPRKRAVKRCKGSSAPIPSPTDDSSSPSSTPTPSQAPVNAGNAPPVFSSSSPAEDPSPSPKPSSTKKTTPAPTPTPTPAKSSGGSGDSSTHSGDGTFYDTGLGACGIVNKDTDFIAAVAHGFFDSFGGGYTNPNNAPICNKKVRATYQGNSVEVTLTDRCGGCDGEALDFSPSAFQQLAPLGVGRIHNVQWVFLD